MTTKQTLFADEESVACLKAPKQVSAPWVEFTPQIISFLSAAQILQASVEIYVFFYIQYGQKFPVWR